MKNQKQIKRLVYSLLISAIIGTTFYACKKRVDSQVNNSEKLLFKADSKTIKNADLGIGNNVNEVFAISYDNDKLDGIKTSKEFLDILKDYDIDKDNIRRATAINSNIDLIKIPLNSHKNKNEQTSLIVYNLAGKHMFAKVNSSTTELNNNRLIVSSVNDKLYYKVDINKENKIGNGQMGEAVMPFAKNLDLKIATPLAQSLPANSVVTNQVPGGKDCVQVAKTDGIYSCMNCLVAEKCASSWVCIAACGLDVIICVGVAGIGCVTASSPSTPVPS